LLIHPVTSEEDAMLPPAEETPATAPAAGPALPAVAAAPAPQPQGEVLEPDLTQLNPGRAAATEAAATPATAGATAEERAVPVAA